MSVTSLESTLGSKLKGAKATFWSFLLLGCTSFGGPVAHIGFFRTAFVHKKRWLDDDAFASLLSLCQFIPGPASSQLGMAIGYHRFGYLGAFSAWLGFTLPSALLLYLFATLLVIDPEWLTAGVIQGLKIVAFAVIVQAFLSMRTSLAPDVSRMAILLICTVLFLAWRTPLAPIVVLSVVGLACAFVRPVDRNSAVSSSSDKAPSCSRVEGLAEQSARGSLVFPAVLLALFFGTFLVAFLPVGVYWEQFLAYYRSGAMVFGGGHVVLPLLQGEIVDAGWVDRNTFLAGYGAAQAVPGPLFTFSAFLGASHEVGAAGAVGALLAVFAIFLPSFLLLFGVLPFWGLLQTKPAVRSALWGVNAAVLGLLLATIIDPVFQDSIHDLTSLLCVVLAFGALQFLKAPVLLVVFLGAVVGGFLL